MPAATLQSDGNMVLPKPIREHLGVRPGDTIDFVVLDDGRVVVRAATGSIEELYGLLHRPGMRPITLSEMEEAIQRGACGDHGR